MSINVSTLLFTNIKCNVFPDTLKIRARPMFQDVSLTPTVQYNTF